jgi:FKBP-type peptidyl-prolyl cis-trans isomerase SlyD
MRITRGKVVSLSYVLRGAEGDVLDRSETGEPLEYLHGYGNIVPGLERALEGEGPGFASRVTVAPEEGYGEVNPEAVFEVPRDRFAPGAKLAPGVEVYAKTPEGTVPLRVVSVSDQNAVLDANHPLAGKDLHFEVEVTAVREATEEEIAHGHAHGAHGHAHGHPHGDTEA